jgi:hypothetical protein
MASVELPEIFLLSLEFQSFLDQVYSSLFDSLSNSARVKRAKSASGAIRYLEANTPKAILVTDEGLTKREHAEVLGHILPYLRNGGLVIIGLHFPNFVHMEAFDNFFDRLGLPWRRGDYYRTTFGFNPSCTLPAGVIRDSMPAPYSMKVLHVKNARQHEKIFVPISDATTQSHVFSPELADESQAAVVGAKVGNGFLVYVGDVNGERGSDQIILSLCGLL